MYQCLCLLLWRQTLVREVLFRSEGTLDCALCQRQGDPQASPKDFLKEEHGSGFLETQKAKNQCASQPGALRGISTKCSNSYQRHSNVNEATNQHVLHKHVLIPRTVPSHVGADKNFPRHVRTRKTEMRRDEKGVEWRYPSLFLVMVMVNTMKQSLRNTQHTR